jgi:aminocarboxymuconate-semialdehyde decarboxylase
MSGPVSEKWDVHTHTALSPATYERLARFSHYADFVRVRAHAAQPCCAELVNGRGEVQRLIGDNAYDAAARLRDCDRDGVTVQVLSPTPMMIPDYVDSAEDAAEICRILNDDNAAIAAGFPRRFLALGALPLRFPELAIGELERIRALGMRGVEINSNVAGLELDEPRFFPVFEAAAALGMAVFIHPWGGFMSPAEEALKRRMNARRNWRPWLIGMGMETALAFDSMRAGGVHERLPSLRVLYAHGGGAFPALLGRLEHGPYCRPDLFPEASKLDPFATIRQCGVYTDSLTHSPWALSLLVQMMGAGRVAMGSDYPYPLGETDPFGADGRDALGNACPYPQGKRIHPGHMIENLPEPGGDMAASCASFPWLHADELPVLTAAQKDSILHKTAKEWLGLAA